MISFAINNHKAMLRTRLSCLFVLCESSLEYATTLELEQPASSFGCKTQWLFDTSTKLIPLSLNLLMVKSRGGSDQMIYKVPPTLTRHHSVILLH